MGYSYHPEDEESLIQELGIDLGGVTKRVMLILTLQAWQNPQVMADADIAGALAVILGTAALHLLVGKFHFGVLLGWSVLVSMGLSWMFSLLSQPDSAGPVSDPVGAFRMLCMMGYCQIPMAGLAALSLVLQAGPLRVALAALAVAWSSFTLATVLVGAMPELRPSRSLVIIPCALFYLMVGVLTLY